MTRALLNEWVSIPGIWYPESERQGEKNFCTLEKEGANKNGTLGSLSSMQNQMADYEAYEYAILNQFKTKTFNPSPVIDSPDDTDYFSLRCSNQVSDVQYQGLCGSCYAFAAVGTMEGAFNRKTGISSSLNPMSVQYLMTSNNVVDMGPDFGNCYYSNIEESVW